MSPQPPSLLLSSSRLRFLPEPVRGYVWTSAGDPVSALSNTFSIEAGRKLEWAPIPTATAVIGVIVYGHLRAYDRRGCGVRGEALRGIWSAGTKEHACESRFPPIHRDPDVPRPALDFPGRAVVLRRHAMAQQTPQLTAPALKVYESAPLVQSRYKGWPSAPPQCKPTD